MKKSSFDNVNVRSVRSQQGFTLVELLIALLILGEIAAFSIPKILAAQQTSSFNSRAKETIGMISQAHTLYKLNTGISNSTKFADMTPYLNYVQMDTSGTKTVDYVYAVASAPVTCNATNKCLFLHNGGVLFFTNLSFAGTTSGYAIQLYFDPDGKVTTGTTNGTGMSLGMFLYATGRITTIGTHQEVTCHSSGCLPSNYPRPQNEPPWFSF